jgi:hypothetical protein
VTGLPGAAVTLRTSSLTSSSLALPFIQEGIRWLMAAFKEKQMQRHTLNQCKKLLEENAPCVEHYCNIVRADPDAVTASDKGLQLRNLIFPSDSKPNSEEIAP